MSEPSVGAVHHIDLNVSDLAASKSVYGPFLEFLGYRCVKDEPHGCEWDLTPDTQRGTGGASIGLKQARREEAGHAHRRYAPGLHHLAWRAADRAMVDRCHALLLDRGIRVLDAPAEYPEYSGDYYAVFFEDPDGIKLELVHAPGWI